MNPRAVRILSLVFLMLGVGPLAGAVFGALYSYRRVEREAAWPVADAVIESCYRERNTTTDDWSYRSTAHWTDAQGQSHEAIGWSADCTPDSRYQVRYNPSDPTEVGSNEGFNWLAPLILGFIGSVFSWIGIKEFLKARRELAAERAKATTNV